MRALELFVFIQELIPALDGPLFQLRLRADDVEVAAVVALVDRQREAPVALLRDHPVLHVVEPVDLSLEAEARHPPDLPSDIHHLVPKLIHRDEPLIHQPPHELRPAAPAEGVAVGVVLNLVEDALLFKAVVYRLA